jgi:hypothetical protein
VRFARRAVSLGVQLDEWGTAAATVVAALLVGSTLLSPQFLIWLVPWVAIAARDGDGTTERLGLAAILTTILAMSLYNASHSDAVGAQCLYWIRNAMLVGLVVAGVRRLRAQAGVVARPSPSAALA